MIEIFNQECVEGIKDINDESIDVILTDPPYLYLKNQKLDRPFDEIQFFNEAKRVLKSKGFIVLFGRGSSFYRWNTILDDLGFTFKEEIIWNKSYITSPLMALKRVHETISIHSKGKAAINRAKVPYIEMKQHDVGSVLQDLKRIKSALNNPKSLNAIQNFLENNVLKFDSESVSKGVTRAVKLKGADRGAQTMRAMEEGLNEKSVIKIQPPNFLNISSEIKNEDRALTTVRSMEEGMAEKSIIKEKREHYKAVHPTQKPVRLLERLLALVSNENDLVLDPFLGSGSTAIACMNMNRRCVGFEIDEQFFKDAQRRIDRHCSQRSLNFKTE